MQTAKTTNLLATLLLAAGCNGQVMLLSSFDGGGDGSPPGCVGAACPALDASPNPDDATSPGYPDAQPDWWNPPPGDSGWYDDAPFQGDGTVAPDVICPISDDAGNCSRLCCEAQDGGPAWTAVPVLLPCTYPDSVCVDDAGVESDAGCDHWCCEPPPGGRGYPMLECVNAGVACTLPATDCEGSDAAWGTD
jgi:hypothetical protein